MVTVAPPAGPARRHSTTPSTPARRLSPALSAPNAQPPRVRFRRPRRPTPPRHLSTRPRRRNHRGRFAGARRARLHYRTTSRHAANTRSAPSPQPLRCLAVVPGTGPLPSPAHAYTAAPPLDTRPTAAPPQARNHRGASPSCPAPVRFRSPAHAHNCRPPLDTPQAPQPSRPLRRRSAPTLTLPHHLSTCDHTYSRSAPSAPTVAAGAPMCSSRARVRYPGQGTPASRQRGAGSGILSAGEIRPGSISTCPPPAASNPKE
jgi:hypothetical protein